MQKSTLAVAMVAVALFVPLSPAHAQFTDDALCTLVMPSGIDPTRLTLTLPGILYSNTDGSIPGDQAGAPITGNLLLTPAFSGGGGLELHGAIPIPSSPNTMPVVEFDLFTDYAGNMGGASRVNTPFAARFTPWGVQALGSVPTGFTQGFRFFKQPGSADINTGEFYGVLSSALNNPADPTGFRNATFGIEGFTTSQVTATPEPGALALLTGMGLSVSLCALKRRRK